MSFNVEVLPDGKWAERTAERFAEVDPARVCLATGKTMTPFLGRIARTDLSGMVVFMLDEFGGLPHDDPGRCESMIRRDLLDTTHLPPTVHIPSVDPPEPDAFQALIDDGGLDLAVVGLGANGHIGMNEPGSGLESRTRVVELAESTGRNAAGYGATTTPRWGVTVGMGPLLASREIWLMVTGGHKREILLRTLTDPVGPDLPATFLREHPNFTVFADESAAS